MARTAAAKIAAGPREPKGLGPAGQELWHDMMRIAVWDDEPHRLAILEEACRTRDLIARLNEILDGAESWSTRGSAGQVVLRGEVAEIRQARALLSSLLTSGLKLPETPAVAEVKARELSAVRAKARRGQTPRRVQY